MSLLSTAPLCVLLLVSSLAVAQRLQTVYEPAKAAASAVAITAARTPKSLSKPLAYFRAEPRPESPLLLRWRTTPDQTGWAFAIERSPDQQVWAALGQVDQADSTGIRTYEFADESPVATAYYRLSYLDKTGKTTQTRLLSVLNVNKGGRGVAYCWFDHTLLYVGFNQAIVKFPASIVLYDQAGQVLCSDACPAPTAEYPVDLTTLTSTPDTPVTLQIVDANHRVLLSRRIDLAKR